MIHAYIVDERYELEGDFAEDLVEYKRNLNDLTPPEESEEG